MGGAIIKLIIFCTLCGGTGYSSAFTTCNRCEGIGKSFMYVVKFTDEDVEKSNTFIKHGALNNSITNGKGNEVGYLGEYIFHRLFGGERVNSYEYDFIMPNGTKVDVKTKRCTSEPKAYYNATVAATNTRQQCDSYYFVRIDMDNHIAYLIGGLPKKEFFRLATRANIGEVEDKMQGWTFKEDCYNVPLLFLKNPKIKK